MLLVLLSPVFLVAAMLVKLTSRGPALFKQERLGLNRRPFVMLKFRTMVVGAEQEEVAFRESNRGTFFKVRNDPRVTRVGSFLRRSSLDELPQFVNILRGEMSLVGPRPLAELELLHFRPWIDLRRFSMKPGLTCIWQVNGRSHTSDEDRMRYDLQYIDQWSLGLDIKLMWKTIPAVLKGDGAV
ncbi:MAG: sugar transferase [Acidobacteria bacterium]|nr:sugar transferase [Acidobacteriota bacterium]